MPFPKVIVLSKNSVCLAMLFFLSPNLEMRCHLLAVQITRSNTRDLLHVGLPQGKGMHRKTFHSCRAKTLHREIATILFDELNHTVFGERERFIHSSEHLKGVKI